MADVAPRVSECTVCPPFTALCAHFGELIVRVDDIKLARSLVSVQHHARKDFTLVGPGREKGCICKQHSIITTPNLAEFPDLPSAQAEFRRREEEMLRPVQPAAPATPKTT